MRRESWRKPKPEGSQIRHGAWSVAGEIEVEHEVRQFVASLLFLTLYDALALAQGKCRKIGATAEIARDRESARRYQQKERTNLLLWIGGRKFHYYCWALGLDDEKVAEYIFRVLRGDTEAIEQFEVAVREIGNYRMVANGS